MCCGSPVGCCMYAHIPCFVQGREKSKIKRAGRTIWIWQSSWGWVSKWITLNSTRQSTELGEISSPTGEVLQWQWWIAFLCCVVNTVYINILFIMMCSPTHRFRCYTFQDSHCQFTVCNSESRTNSKDTGLCLYCTLKTVHLNLMWISEDSAAVVYWHSAAKT